MKEARLDAATRQFMFSLVGLTKTLPDKSKDILKNINLSFYPGAKIGVVGLNGSGKVSVYLHHELRQRRNDRYFIFIHKVNTSKNHGR